MSKELPYFRFTVQDWQNGKISLESFELQGLFISVCGYYWINDCVLTLTMLRKKFSNATSLLEQLIELGIIKHENRHDKIEIVFLNEQYDLLSEKRKRRQDAGSKGGNAKAMLKQKRSYKDKDNNKDNDKIEAKSIGDKVKDFENEVRSFKGEYSEPIIVGFINYWAELDKKKTKMRWEKEDTFEIPRRLVTWYNNDIKFKEKSFNNGKTETIQPRGNKLS